MLTKKLRGKLGEILAKFYLKLKFYKILKQNYKLASGEIDLIAKLYNQIVFVEIKSKSSIKYYDQNIISLTQKKRIINSAKVFLQKNPQYSNYQIRFDLIIIISWRLPIHIKNAWIE